MDFCFICKMDSDETMFSHTLKCGHQIDYCMDCDVHSLQSCPKCDADKPRQTTPKKLEKKPEPIAVVASPVKEKGKAIYPPTKAQKLTTSSEKKEEKSTQR